MISIPQDTPTNELLSKNSIRFFCAYHVSKLLRAAITNEDRIQALLIDDTLFTRARSKKVETAC